MCTSSNSSSSSSSSPSPSASSSRDANGSCNVVTGKIDRRPGRQEEMTLPGAGVGTYSKIYNLPEKNVTTLSVNVQRIVPVKLAL